MYVNQYGLHVTTAQKLSMAPHYGTPYALLLFWVLLHLLMASKFGRQLFG